MAVYNQEFYLVQLHTQLQPQGPPDTLTFLQQVHHQTQYWSLSCPFLLVAEGFLAVIYSQISWKKSWVASYPAQSRTTTKSTIAIAGIVVQAQLLIAITTGPGYPSSHAATSMHASTQVIQHTQVVDFSFFVNSNNLLTYYIIAYLYFGKGIGNGSYNCKS